MKGDAKVIEHLNKILYNELVAINQYFLHSKMYKDWGLVELAEHEYHESIDEMKHADELVERIFISRDLVQRILDAEEEHIDWLETQLSLMDRVGEQNYLQTAMKTVKPTE